MIRKFLGLGLCVAAPLCAAAESANEFMDRVLRAEKPTPGVFVQVHRTFTNGKAQKLTMSRDERGRSLYTILEPLQMQGWQTYDDGNSLQTLFPDRRFVQTRLWGSRQATLNPDLRLRLIEKNYKLSIDSGPKICGLLTTKITAVPRNSQLPKRTMYFRRGTTLLLRIDLAAKNKAPVTVFEILSQAPNTEPVEPPNTSGWKRETTWGPRPLGRPFQARAFAGITAVFPKSLPYGFELVDSWVNGRTQDTAFVLSRLTDGFVLVNLIQANPALGVYIDGAERATERGVLFVADGQAPSELLRDLLQAYTSSKPQALDEGTLRTDLHVSSLYDIPSRSL